MNKKENIGYVLIDIDDESFNQKIESLLYLGIKKENIIIDYEKGVNHKNRKSFEVLLRMISENKVKNVVVLSLKDMDVEYGDALLAVLKIENEGNGARVFTLDKKENMYNVAENYRQRHLSAIIL